MMKRFREHITEDLGMTALSGLAAYAIAKKAADVWARRQEQPDVPKKAWQRAQKRYDARVRRKRRRLAKRDAAPPAPSRTKAET